MMPEEEKEKDPENTGENVAAPAAPNPELQKELEAAKAQAAEYLEGWQRSRAEFANYKRRVEKEQSEAYQNATGRVIGRFVDVLDDFNRAVTDKPADMSDATALAQWAAGVGLIRSRNFSSAERARKYPSVAIRPEVKALRSSAFMNPAAPSMAFSDTLPVKPSVTITSTEPRVMSSPSTKPR